ncbi:MAG: HAD-IIIA family hydrolase [Bacteroidota bacterium]|jgi:YrbI family 3-deoxy-D-manno-octulosonate 8-phosphate phosphatase
MNKTLTAKLKKIKILVTDVDGVLTDSGAYYSDEGIELKKFSIRDGMGISLMQKAGYIVAIVTTEKTKIVERRAERLKVTDIYQGVINKVAAVEELLKKYSLTWQELAYIGDDINDLPVLKKAGFAAAPSNATKINKKIADFVTQAEGGHGAVREVCDLLLDLKWKGESIADLWLTK